MYLQQDLYTYEYLQSNTIQTLFLIEGSLISGNEFQRSSLPITDYPTELSEEYEIAYRK